MVGFRPGIARRCWRPGRVASLAITTGLLAAACGPAQTAATGAATANGTARPSPSASPPPSSTTDCDSIATCYTPQQLEVAYGVQPLLARGIDGSGETVVLPEVLDAEVLHAIAPRAALTIVLVKGTSLDSADQAVAASVAALRLGASEGGIISLSPAGQIGGEHCVDDAQLTQLNAALQADADRHVTVVAATGDAGAAGEPCALIDAIAPPGISSSFTPRKEVSLLASDPLVLGAGGTTLDASHTTGTWTGETTWGLPDGSPGSGFQASGGGFSHLFRRPSYQDGVRGIGSMRGVPDVAADANPSTGVPVVTSNAGGGYTISGHGGTSASAPIWAGIIALADQYAGRHLGFVNPAIYAIASSSAYHEAFHDVTVGNANTAEFPRGTIAGYRAGPGWDPVTGWGSPNAEVLVPLLARYATR
jgi:subtilase family serine protease